jgi:5'-methylthioadenosine phosphorylase
MTNLQEAKLAREAEMCFASLALVTDYDCWHESEKDVDVTAVLEVLRQNADLARRVVVELARLVGDEPLVTAEGCMQHALITRPDAVTADARRRLQLLIGRYLG